MFETHILRKSAKNALSSSVSTSRDLNCLHIKMHLL